MTTLSSRSYEAMQASIKHSAQREEVLRIGSRLLHRAQENGSMRKDIDIGDVVLALILVSKLIPPSDDELGEMVFRRLIALMMDGLRGSATTPLPGRPIGYEDIEVLRGSGFVKPGH
jgi:hypothetical protein